MGEEVRASSSGANGERLEVRMGTKAIGLQAQSLIPILLLLSGLVGGYLVWRAVDTRLEGLHANHVRMFELLLNGQQTRQNEAQQILRWLQIHQVNQNRPPEDQLPLDFDPAHVPPKKLAQ